MPLIVIQIYLMQKLQGYEEQQVTTKSLRCLCKGKTNHCRTYELENLGAKWLFHITSVTELLGTADGYRIVALYD